MNNKLFIIVAILLIAVGGYYFLSVNKQNDSGNMAVVDNIDEMMGDGNSMVDDVQVPEEDGVMVNEDVMIEDGPTGEENGSMMEDSETRTFEVGGGSFYFTPDEITVSEGDTVKIIFTNEGGVHDWVIDEFDARTPIIQAGETSTVEFIADQAGSFEFYCSVGNHRAQGMVGTLTVLPK